MIHPLAPTSSLPLAVIAEEAEPRTGEAGAHASSLTPALGDNINDAARSALGAEQGAALTAVTAGLGGVHDELEINIRLTRAPVDAGHVGHEAGTNLATTGLTLGTPEAGLSVGRTSVLAAVPMPSDGLVAHLGSTSGLLYGSIGQTVGNTTITGFHGYVGPVHASGLTTTTNLGGVNVGSGLAVVGTGDASLKVAQYQGGQMQVVYQDSLGGSLQLTGGVSTGYLGICLRLAATGKHEFEFQTWLSPDKTASILQKNTRLQARMSGLRLRPKLLEVPDLSDPLNTRTAKSKRVAFRIGDEIKISYAGNISGGVAVTGAGLYAGVHVSFSGTHSLQIIKLTDTDVSVDIIPRQQTRAITFSADFPLAAEANAVLAQSRATRYSYAFDLTEPAALKAYLNTLKGDMPGPIVTCNDWHAMPTGAAQRIVAQANLPAGVTYTLLEQAAVPFERTRRASLTLPKYLPFTNLAGIGIERRDVREESVIADAQGAIFSESTTRTNEIQALHRGTLESTSFGTLTSARRSTDDVASLEGVTVGIVYSNDRTRRDTRNKVVAELNRVIFTDDPLALFGGPKQTTKYNYEISLLHRVSPETLARIAPAGRSVREQAQALQREVTRFGLTGFANVMKRLGGSAKDIEVKVQSRAPTAIWDKVLQLSARYNRPIDPTKQKTKDINARIGKVDKYLQAVETVREDVESDVLLNKLDKDGKAEQLALLGATNEALVRLVKLDGIGPNQYHHMKKEAARDIRKILERWDRKPPAGVWLR